MLRVEQPQDLLVDPAVQRLEEMLGAELELDVLGQPVVDHQRAEQRRLRLDIVRKRHARRRLRRFDDGKRLSHDATLRLPCPDR